MDSVGIASSPFIFAEPIIAQSYKKRHNKKRLVKAARRAKNTQAIPEAWVLVRTEEAFPRLKRSQGEPSPATKKRRRGAKEHPGHPGSLGVGRDGRSVSVSKKESVRTVAGGFDKPSHMVSLS